MKNETVPTPVATIVSNDRSARNHLNPAVCQVCDGAIWIRYPDGNGLSFKVESVYSPDDIAASLHAWLAEHINVVLQRFGVSQTVG